MSPWPRHTTMSRLTDQSNSAYVSSNRGSEFSMPAALARRMEAARDHVRVAHGLPSDFAKNQVMRTLGHASRQTFSSRTDSRSAIDRDESVFGSWK